MERTCSVKCWAILVFLLLATGRTEASGFPEPVVPEGLGVASHFHAAPGKTDLDLLQRAGIRVARTSVTWKQVEKERGGFDFTRYVQLADSLAAGHVRPLFVLAYGNPLYIDGAPPYHQGPVTAEARAAFVRYATAAAGALRGRGIIWEIWNEPNLPRFWAGARAADYMALVREVVPALRQGDPSGLIIAPALASANPAAAAFLQECFRLGLLELVDGISVHPYGRRTPEAAVAYYAQVRSWMRDLNGGKSPLPLVSSEWGYSSAGVSREEQGDYAARMYLVNLAEGVPLTIWYDWRDDGTDPNNREHHFGLLGHDHAPKPAFHAVQELTGELAGFRFVRRLPAADGSDWLLLFEKEGATKVAAWTTEKPHTAAISLPGREAPLTVPLTRRPQYLSLEGAAASGY